MTDDEDLDLHRERYDVTEPREVDWPKVLGLVGVGVVIGAVIVGVLVWC